MDLHRTLASLRYRVRYSGLRGVLWRVFEDCLAPIGQVGLESICRKDLAVPLVDMTPRADVDISVATEDDIDQLVGLVESNWHDSDEVGPYTELGGRGTIVDRFQRGEKCFVAKIGTDIVHYNWIAFDREEAIAGTGLIVCLTDGQEAVCHDGFTVEAWRGMGIHPAVNSAMLRWLKESGYRYAYTVVGTVSRSSNITHHRLDWEFTGVMLYLISRRTGKARVWRLKGTLAPFHKTAT